MTRECESCLNNVGISSTSSYCPTCIVVGGWLPSVRYASEMDGLGLTNRSDRLYLVYVLDTDIGTYIGHTANIARRLEQHTTGRVRSTALVNPRMVWQSQPFRTRRDADNAERVFKTLRDIAHEDFSRVTGVAPSPWLGGDVNQGRRYPVRRRRRRRGRYVPARRGRPNYLLAIVVGLSVVVGIYALNFMLRIIAGLF